MNMKVALTAANKNALALDDFIIRPEEKMNLMAGATKPGAIKTSHGPATDHRDFHGRNPGISSCLSISFNPNKKGTPNPFRVPRENGKRIYLAPRMASLAALATRNFTTFLAGIWMVSPVAGVRARRGFWFKKTRFPRPRRGEVFFWFFFTNSAKGSGDFSAC